ncbi:MAG TPA: AAA family ATPase [Candidatus Eremiobacteraeota bacterium]|nr:AAA family ATPase [Candidatus Eremiobacteraeota bacterium]
MRIISIANQKGGCAKTTTAINLSACLAIKDKKVLLIDLDPQAHASVGLNIETPNLEYTIYDVLTRDVPLEKTIINISENFDLVPSDIVLSAAELELAGVIGRENELSTRIKKLNMSYDYIIIDCPPSLGLLTFNALKASKEVMITIETSYFALHGVGKLLQTLRLLEEKLNHHISYCALATMHDKRTNLAREVLEEIRSYFKDKTFKTVINMNVKLKEATSHGLPIIKYAPQSQGAQDYMALAQEVISHE